jgi:hypothetical protein
MTVAVEAVVSAVSLRFVMKIAVAHRFAVVASVVLMVVGAVVVVAEQTNIVKVGRVLVMFIQRAVDVVIMAKYVLLTNIFAVHLAAPAENVVWIIVITKVVVLALTVRSVWAATVLEMDRLFVRTMMVCVPRNV